MEHSGRSRRGRRTQADDDKRLERTQVFTKTKMCKFHILGSCQRGTQCRFAHDQSELQALPDLTGTKLCKTLVQTGQCQDPNCTYAHSKDEFRIVPGFSAQESLEDSGSTRRPQQLHNLSDVSRQVDQVPVQAAKQQMYFGGADFQQQQMMPCAAPVFFVPSMVQTAECSMLSDDKAMKQHQRAMQQMGAAAQAHAAEALRLQAMAAFLQAQAASGQTNGFPEQTPELSASGPVQGRIASNASPAIQDQVKGAGVGSSKLGGNARNGLSSAQPQPAQAPSSNSINEDTFIAREPAQIALGSLRSLSSNSLPVQADDDDEFGEKTFQRGAQQSSQVLKVKNTFIDLDTDRTPLAARLRPVCSAAGRLDALGAGIGEEDEDPPMMPSSSQSVSASIPTLTPMQEPAHSMGSAGYAKAGAGRVPANGLGSGLYVKNTFLDFATEETPALRAVHTAAGRLDLLAEDVEE
eukprot:TRINITY_DN9385_c0_g1_i1.p1 TRINITY_DN9385_c0_g1~~TRINITY_DN9385_c0_g1_i1.p1  ORF type:complete len:475 (+),score=102.39 TRINITY_DN9385_c0_g1_i1:32-1426(+)